MKKLIKILSVILLTALLFTMTASAYAAGSVPSAVLKAEKSVVRVFGFSKDTISTGSGFAIANNRNMTYIVTNYHVIEGCSEGYKVFIDEQSYDMDIKACSPEKDICILSISEKLPLKPLKLDTKPVQGEAVYAIGFPGDADELSDTIAVKSEDATLTDGIISAIRSLSITKTGNAVTLLQINADINHGNSGGPLLNKKGEVLGITTYGVSSGINGAISSADLLEVLQGNGIVISHILPILVCVLAVVVALCTIAIIFRRKMKIKSGVKENTAIKLNDYLTSSGGQLSIEQIVPILMPIAVELRNMHNEGRPHLELSPDTISLSDSSVILVPPTGLEANRYISGYAAPEVYKGTNAGASTDVYSFCAVLYKLLTGNVPQNALSRDGDLLQEGDLNNSAIEQLINRGMALDPNERFSSMQDIISILAPFNTGRLPCNVNTAANATASSATEKIKSVKKEKVKKRKPAKVVLSLIGILLVLTIAGYFGTYLLAINQANHLNFAQAAKLAVLPEITKLHDNDFYLFLKSYENMEKKDFEGARNSINATEGYYVWNEPLLTEIDYQDALFDFKNGNYRAAIFKISRCAAQNYKDAKVLRVNICEEAVNSAIDYIENGNFEEADTILNYTKYYYSNEETQLLKAICDAYVFTYDLGGRNYEFLIQNLDYDAVKSAIVNNYNYLKKFLSGSWKDANSNKKFEWDTTKSFIYDDFPKPFSSGSWTYDFDSGIMYSYKDENDMKKDKAFTIIDEDTIELYCFKDRSTYILYRQ